MPQSSAPKPGDAIDAIEAISGMISPLTLRLQERGDQLHATIASSPDGFVSFGTRLRVNCVSATFTSMTGLAVDGSACASAAWACRPSS